MSSSLVSIIIPICNAQETLGRCLESVVDIHNNEVLRAKIINKHTQFFPYFPAKSSDKEDREFQVSDIQSIFVFLIGLLQFVEMISL